MRVIIAKIKPLFSLMLVFKAVNFLPQMFEECNSLVILKGEIDPSNIILRVMFTIHLARLW